MSLSSVSSPTDAFGAYGRSVFVSDVGAIWLPTVIPFHLPRATGSWCLLSQGTLCLLYVSLTPYGDGLIFVHGKAGGCLGWGGGRSFLGSSMVSTTAKVVDSVSYLP